METTPHHTDNQPKGKSESQVLNLRISEILLKSGDTLQEMVLNQLIEAELSRRAEKVVKALDEIKSLQKEVNKESKPDVVYFESLDSKSPIQRFSPEKLKKIKEIKSKIDKIEKAIELIFNGDASKLDNLIK